MPFDAYRELLTADLEDKSIFAEVERVGGTPIVSVGYRTVEAVRANTEQAAELGIAPHDPLLNLRAGFTGPGSTLHLWFRRSNERRTGRRCKRP